MELYNKFRNFLYENINKELVNHRNTTTDICKYQRASVTRFGVAITVKMHFLELSTSAYVTDVNKKVNISL
jgi:hypothetical protein